MKNQKLSIVFSAQSLDTYAYVNGIEIISVPAGLSYFMGNGIRVIGKNSLVYVDNSTAFEVVHRISIKHDLVSSSDDSGDIFAMWLDQRVDNRTWKVPVDVGFKYLVRLHLSRFKGVGLSFKVLINQVVSSYCCDTERERDDRYEDFVVMMNGRKQEGKRYLLVFLQWNQEHMDTHGPVKGFEILKLSNTDNSLAAPNPQPLAQDSPSKTFRTVFMILGRRNAIATIAITALSLVNIIVHQLLGSWEACSSEEINKPSPGAERVCRRFSLAEIRRATKNFNGGLVIGNGGFGKVYKGLIDEGQKTVAIKKLKPYSRQGAPEFLNEIETLSEIRHINVVSLIGYCNEHKEMIIVYEYMACGTLADHLYKLPRDNSEFSCLTWKQRLNICIGVARGLEYLHTGCGIIHRDLKASNILLDENVSAKVSDFGLAKPQEKIKLQSHVSTNVKGTFGYIDPYYETTRKLISKSDTYSFGVVLLEVLCGRRAVDSEVLEDERILTKWAQDKISKGEVDHVIASSIREEISPYSLRTFVGVAGRCLDKEPKNRPTMSEVVLQLEFALKQQDSNQDLVLNEIVRVSDRDEIGETTCKVVVDAEPTSGTRQWTKFITTKLLRTRPWQALWKKIKPSKKHKPSFLDHVVTNDADNSRNEFSRIRAAISDFCEGIGQGGFGTSYKGKLLNGQEVAVKVTAVDLTGSGIHSFDTNNIKSLSQYVKPLNDFMEKLTDGEKVVLIGHGLGSTCISHAMEICPAKVSKVVFLSGAMLMSGRNALDIFSDKVESNELMRQAKVFLYANGNDHPPTAIDFDKSILRDWLSSQSPTKGVAVATVSMRPTPFSPVREKHPLLETNHGAVRRFYVETPEDNAVESMMNRSPPERVFRLKGADHSPFSSKPQARRKHLHEISVDPAN